MNISIDVGFSKSNVLLKDLNLSFQPGDIINLVGNNGSGKSTFYRTLTGELLPVSGSVSSEIRNNISVISDRCHPPKELYVKELFKFLDDNQLSKLQLISQDVASFIKGLTHKKIKHLSSGQERMVCIAAALCLNCKILVLDEAFAALDFENREMCIRLLKTLKNTVIFNTSHDLENILDFSGRVFCINTRQKALVEYTGSLSSIQELKNFIRSQYI